MQESRIVIDGKIVDLKLVKGISSVKTGYWIHVFGQPERFVIAEVGCEHELSYTFDVTFIVNCNIITFKSVDKSLLVIKHRVLSGLCNKVYPLEVFSTH